jgi:hypothetical protein
MFFNTPLPGRKESQEGKETDPEEGWVPKKFGCRLQEGVPPCNSGMAQEEHFKEILDAGKLWTGEGSDCSRSEDYSVCRTRA